MTASFGVFPALFTLGALFSFGAAVLALLCVLPRTSMAARSLWPILLTEVIILASGSGPMLLGGPVLALFLWGLSARVLYECFIVGARRCGVESGADLTRRGVWLATAAGAAITAAGYLLAFPLVMAGCAILGLLLFVAVAMPWGKHANPTLVASAETVLFPGLFLVLFASAAADPDLRGALLIAFLLVETHDSYALLGGKIAGRRKAFPKLSPNKTVEGLAFGALALSVTTIVVGHFVFAASPLAMLVLAVLVAFLSSAGDLSASRLKRLAGVKDYPTILPRQGGAFDIADAWIMTGPVIAAASSWYVAG